MVIRTNSGTRVVFIAAISFWFAAVSMVPAGATDSLITGTSVGLVRLGATTEEIRQSYSDKRVHEVNVPLEGDTKSRAVQIQDGNEVLITVEVSKSGRAWRITTQQPAFKTSRGVGVGSTFRDLIRVHGKPSSFEFPEGALFAVYAFPDGMVGFQLNQGFDEALFEKKNPPATATVVRVVVMKLQHG
jgi:hypothetical protein